MIHIDAISQYDDDECDHQYAITATPPTLTSADGVAFPVPF